MAASKSKKSRQEKAPPVPPGPDNSKILWGMEPVVEQWGVATCHRWVSLCGRYSVCRVDSRGRDTVEYAAEFRLKCNTGDGHRWSNFEYDSKRSGNYPQCYRSMALAVQALERYHCQKHQVDSVESNKNDLLEKVGLMVDKATSRSDNTDTSPATHDQEERMMKVKEVEARAMLESMDLACDGSVKSLTKRLGKLPVMASEGKEPEGDHKALFDRISKALEDGQEILVLEEGAAKEEKASPKEKVKKGGKAHAEKNGTSPTKGKKASKESKGERGQDRPKDKFGSYVDSSNAIVNKVLSRKTPKTFGEIVKETGLNSKQVRYAHLDSLVKNGHAVRTDAGWALI